MQKVFVESRKDQDMRNYERDAEVLCNNCPICPDGPDGIKKSIIKI